MSTLIIFGAGLIIGWNVFPQPAWVKNLYDKAVAKVKAVSDAQL